MGEYGLKIRNIKAATLYGCRLGVKERYDFTGAVLGRSLFLRYLEQNGLSVYKKESTRDIICLDFDFGTRSYEEEREHFTKLLDSAADRDERQRLKAILDRIDSKRDLYVKKTKEEIREDFYNNDISVVYETAVRKTGEIRKETITYRMLYRNASKAKTGQAMFINRDLYEKAYDWMTMGLGNKMPQENAKIVELSAYAPLVTSTIPDTMHIPVEDILILKDQDSFFRTIADVVRSEDYETEEKVIDEEETERNRKRAEKEGRISEDGGAEYKKAYKKARVRRKKCIVSREKLEVKNTLWDGMALVEADLFPSWVNGMGLLRNHFFKACGFKGYLQKFFKAWCGQKGFDYETYEVADLFGVRHRLTDIKVITTDNAIKWKKFIDQMGGTARSAYEYWCGRVNADGSIFGIVKTDHKSKLGDVQQMSYQMINTLPCTREEVKEIAGTSMDYVERLKSDNEEFEKYLRKNANEINHYEMLADLYAGNHAFAASKWFRLEKSKIITAYLNRLRKGKITVHGDNLTICGNPYALLLYSVGEDFLADPTLNREEGAIQCYTTRFEDGQYLCAFRNPHNSPNNVCFLHNRYSRELEEYFPFSPNILAINCIASDIQDRANGCDEDSDFFFVTDHPVMIRCARQCYRNFPTIVNRLKEGGITYRNTKSDYARMDNKLAASQRYIGESSNLAQLAMTYYWTYGGRELYDNFVILAVLAQVVIDSCKRGCEVDAAAEIERIKRLDRMNLKKTVLQDGKEKTIRCDLPEFMNYTKEIAVTRNGSEPPYDEVKAKRDKIKSRINPDLVCPMNWLQEWLGTIRGISKTNTVDTADFFIKMEGKPNSRQMSKIRSLVEEYDRFARTNRYAFERDDDYTPLMEKTAELLEQMKKVKIGNPVTVNRLIETALGLDSNTGGRNYPDATKYTRKMLNLLYRSNKELFLSNFKRG